MTQRKQPIPVWHSLALADVSKQLDASERGLSEDEANVRLSEYGPNKLPQKPPAALWQIVLRQFTSPLIYILALGGRCFRGNRRREGCSFYRWCVGLERRHRCLPGVEG